MKKLVRISFYNRLAAFLIETGECQVRTIGIRLPIIPGDNEAVAIERVKQDALKALSRHIERQPNTIVQFAPMPSMAYRGLREGIVMACNDLGLEYRDSDLQDIGTGVSIGA